MGEEDFGCLCRVGDGSVWVALYRTEESEVGTRKEHLTDWVVCAKAEAESVTLVFVKGVGIEDLDVHFPLFQVVCVDERYAWGKPLLYLLSVSVVVVRAE